MTARTMAREVSFDVDPTASRLIRRLVKKAQGVYLKLGLDAPDTIELSMDLTATHANGCPLDLPKMLTFDDFNLMHDVGGIRRHLDRKTGKLGGFFLPRAALPSREGR